MLLSFSTDNCQVNCCHFSISLRILVNLQLEHQAVYVFHLNCYLVPSGVDHRKRDLKPYKGKGIGILQNSRTDRLLLETDRQTPVLQKPLKNAVFRSVLLSPSTVFSPVFSQLYQRCFISVITQPCLLCETSGYLQGIFHVKKCFQSCRQSVKV